MSPDDIAAQADFIIQEGKEEEALKMIRELRCQHGKKTRVACVIIST